MGGPGTGRPIHASVGSTQTAHAATDLTGVTELRAGVYDFFDLIMKQSRPENIFA